MTHLYLGINFEVEPVNGMYCVLLNSLPVTGTHSQSPGEAAMRFMLMVDDMLERESMTMQLGDVLEIDNKLYMVDSISLDSLLLREGLGDGNTNTRDIKFMYDIEFDTNLQGGNFIKRKRCEKYVLVDIQEVEFSCRQFKQHGTTFNYKRDVNVWREVEGC